MSLGVDGASETLVHAFIRKMPPRGETVVDKRTGEEYRVKQGVGGGTTFHIPQHATEQAKINKEERDNQDYIEEYVDKIQRGAKDRMDALHG